MRYLVIMKCILFTCALLLYLNASAQCVSGDCENGVGEQKFALGIYKGQFENGLPHGTGEFRGLVNQTNYWLDSVYDVGVFQFGRFINGKRTRLAENELMNPKFNPPPANRPVRWLRNFWVYQTISPSPESKDYPKNPSGKEKKYSYEASILHSSFVWYGDVKKGFMHGKGNLSANNQTINVEFDKGVLTKIPTIMPPINNQNSNWRMQSFVTGNLKDGLIYEATYFLTQHGKTDTMILQYPANIFDLVNEPITNGYFIVKYNYGSFYEGNVEATRPHGYGVIRHANGGKYSGYFYKGFLHGNGIFENAAEKDSGYFIFNRMVKGNIQLNGGKAVAYPACITGDCLNGWGKVQYIFSPNDTTSQIHDGYFTNGIKNGWGKTVSTRGKTVVTREGNFVAGQLNGRASITATSGLIKEMNGEFERDTLRAGTVVYFDGTRHEFTGNAGNEAIVFDLATQKKVTGFATYYTAKGARVSGEFNSTSTLIDGEYLSPQGIRYRFGRSGLSTMMQYRVPYDFHIDGLDYTAELLNQKIMQEVARLENERAEYLAYQQRMKELDAKLNDPGNWRQTTSSTTCPSCRGAGNTIYTNTFGGDVETEYVDNKGLWQKGIIKRTGRTYTTKVKCYTCNGSGKLHTVGKTYIGN